MERTYAFSQAAINRLIFIVGEHATRVESAERWADDRDETYEWKHIYEELAHLGWCSFRKKYEANLPIQVTLDLKIWKQIKKLLTTAYKKKIHPLYTITYPQELKKYKKNPEQVARIRETIKQAKESWSKNREQISLVLEEIKQGERRWD